MVFLIDKQVALFASPDPCLSIKTGIMIMKLINGNYLVARTHALPRIVTDIGKEANPDVRTLCGMIAELPVKVFVL